LLNFKTYNINSQSAYSISQSYLIWVLHYNFNVIIDDVGPDYYLKADVPVSLISNFSKTMMSNFQGLDGFHNAVDFSFSTILGDDPDIGWWSRYWVMIQILGDDPDIGWWSRYWVMIQILGDDPDIGW
jgi:hypothetical protein